MTNKSVNETFLKRQNQKAAMFVYRASVKQMARLSASAYNRLRVYFSKHWSESQKSNFFLNLDFHTSRASLDFLNTKLDSALTSKHAECLYYDLFVQIGFQFIF